MLLNTLKSLSRDLETTYDQILQRINEKEIPSVQTILQWLILGMRPLRLEELAVLVTFNPSSGKFDSSLGFLHPDDAIQLCYSLVTKAANGTVQLAHASVKEYFLAKPRTILSNIETGHTSIAYCCLKYILLDEKKISLLKYSFQFWPDHYKLSNKNATLFDTATFFFQAEGSHWQINRWVTDFYERKLHLLRMRRAAYDPFYYAVALGLQDVTENLIKSNKTYDFNLAVAVAARSGHIGIMRMMLDKGVNVNANSRQYGNPLEQASHGGHAEIIKLLLDTGANVNAKGGKYGSALQAASYSGHAKIIRLLLNTGADVNAKGGEYGGALQAASFGKGHTETVELLLEKGADVNAKGGYFGNALQAAAGAYNGSVEIVRLLLENGAHVNAKGGEFGNALQAGAYKGSAEIVRLPLENGADVNAKGGKYGSALRAASSNGHAEIVRVLKEDAKSKFTGKSLWKQIVDYVLYSS